MNLSSVGVNVTLLGNYRDTFTTAVTKNVIVVALCISINYINGTLVHTFRKHQIFTVNPRYILFIHLVINDIMQLALSGFLHVISYILYRINVSFCIFLLIITILTSFNTPVNLAVMAVECYIIICIPLRHGQICTVKKTYVLIGLIWMASALSILPDVFILLATEPLQFFHSKVFCARDYVFRSTYILEKRDAFHIVLLVLVWLILFYTYFRILFAVKEATADVKKARNTILLHGFQLLLCMLIYVQPMLQNGLQYLFPMQFLAIRFTCYLIVQILPRFLRILKLNPRYILFIHLVTNDMIQLTVSISLFTLTYTFYTINVSICCLLILPAIFTTQNTPLNLACMAVECYIAVCIPLRHGQLCTVKRTHVVIGLIWAMSVLSVLPDLFIILATEPLQFFHSRVFCNRDYVFRSSYSLRKRDASHILFLVVVWLVLFCAYFRILFAAKAADGDVKKARNTILLHGFQLLLCMLTYIHPALLIALFEWFPKKYSHSVFVCYIIIQILPRFISPIVYGLRDQTFRRYLKRYLLCTVSRGINPQTTLKVYT